MMFTQLLKKSPILLLALNLLACSVLTPAVPTPRAADIDKEEQAVYSFFVAENNKALILQDTSTNMSSDDPQQTDRLYQIRIEGYFQ